MEAFCTNPSCPNYGLAEAPNNNSLYIKNGPAYNGGQKYQCRACGKHFIFQPYILHGSQRSSETRLLVIRLLLSGESIRGICARADVAPTVCYNHILQVNNIMTEYEKAKLQNIGDELSFTLEKCEKLPAEIEYDKNTLYLKSINLIKQEETEAPPESSDAIKNLEKHLIKKLSIFKGHRRMSRSPKSAIILNVFRISHNFTDFIHRGDTPAMRIGLESQPLSMQQLISLRL